MILDKPRTDGSARTRDGRQVTSQDPITGRPRHSLTDQSTNQPICGTTKPIVVSVYHGSSRPGDGSLL